MALPKFYNQGDQDIYNSGQHFIPQEDTRLDYKKPLPMSETEQVTQSYGIPYTNAFTGGGDGGGSGGSGAYTGREYNPESYVTNRGYLSGDYIQGTEPPPPNKLQKFGQMVGAGIMNFVPGMKFIRGLDKFNTLSPSDQEFARQQMSFNEGSAFDNIGNLPNQDRYGYNKRSLMGNYANVIAKRVAIAKKYQADPANKDKKIRDIDQYYLDKEEEQNTLTNQMKFNDFIRQRHSANKIREQQKLGIDLYPSGKDIHGDPSGPDTPKDTPPRHPPSTWTPAGGNGGGTGSPDGGAQAAGDLAGGSALDSPFAQGGRTGYRNGEFVDEDINIQGPNFDVNENVEMAETSPFEIRIEELMDEGMSWEEAYQIASQEFSSAEGQGDSFSEEGIASIV